MVAIVAGTIIGGYIYSLFFITRDVSLNEIASDPQSFDGAHVQLHGYIVRRSPMFGPRYKLIHVDNKTEIHLSGGLVDLEPYVSFVYVGAGNYTQIRDILEVNVVGYIHYNGPITDAPPFYLIAEQVEPSTTKLETIIMDIDYSFLLILVSTILSIVGMGALVIYTAIHGIRVCMHARKRKLFWVGVVMLVVGTALSIFGYWIIQYITTKAVRLLPLSYFFHCYPRFQQQWNLALMLQLIGLGMLALGEIMIAYSILVKK